MKNEALKIVRGKLGGAQDNLYRANMQFGNMTESELDQDYGQSQKSCRSILQGYQDEESKIEKCLQWLEKCPA